MYLVEESQDLVGRQGESTLNRCHIHLLQAEAEENCCLAVGQGCGDPPAEVRAGDGRNQVQNHVVVYKVVRVGLHDLHAQKLNPTLVK